MTTNGQRQKMTFTHICTRKKKSYLTTHIHTKINLSLLFVIVSSSARCLPLNVYMAHASFYCDCRCRCNTCPTTARRKKNSFIIGVTSFW